jgi:hypothetical protein
VDDVTLYIGFLLFPFTCCTEEKHSKPLLGGEGETHPLNLAQETNRDPHSTHAHTKRTLQFFDKHQLKKLIIK